MLDTPSGVASVFLLLGVAVWLTRSVERWWKAGRDRRAIKQYAKRFYAK